MTTSNQDLIRKADLALADLSAAGGILQPEMSNRFIRRLIDSPTIMSQARVVRMNSPTMKLNKIGFGSRILRPAVEATALDAADRVKPDFGQLEMTTKELIAELQMPYQVLEDSIERGNINVAMDQSPGGLHATIVQLMAERAALDLEELMLAGDTASGDTYLATMDGFMKRAVSHVVDAGGATINKNILKAGVKAMPDKFLRNRAQMVHFMSVDNETEYRDTYANRQTALGDNMLQGLSPLFAWGSQVQGVPLMSNSTGLYTNPNNLIFGIQREITIEYDKDIRRRVFIIVLTMRVGLQIEEEDAVVKYINIG